MAPIDGRRLQQRIQQDPSLPVSNPTLPAWLIPESPIANVKSSSLPAKVDYTIIGSGVTGCSVTKSLLEHPKNSNAKVAVLEARTLCSGATGRNGGHLMTAVVDRFPDLCDFVGPDMAAKIARFCSATLEQMHEIGNTSGEDIKTTSEVRRVQGVLCFENEEIMNSMKSSIARYEELVPEEKGRHTFYEKEAARSQFGLHNVVGAMTLPGGAFWPYRLVTGVFKQLYEKFSGRLAIETQTPATEISFDPSDASYPYLVHTPRGSIRSAKVLHCTNAYAGHLLPYLRGKVYPFRGTMTAQKACPPLPNDGNNYSWAFRKPPGFDPKTGVFTSGLDYMTQNGRFGIFFLGGDEPTLDTSLTNDDSREDHVQTSRLLRRLPEMFQGNFVQHPPKFQKTWSGIIGLTADELPIVGQIPKSQSTRPEGDGEWVVAGFNGHGMPNCWGCGEALVGMVMGDDVSAWFPEAYLASEARLEEGMSIDIAIQTLTGMPASKL